MVRLAAANKVQLLTIAPAERRRSRDGSHVSNRRAGTEGFSGGLQSGGGRIANRAPIPPRPAEIRRFSRDLDVLGRSRRREGRGARSDQRVDGSTLADHARLWSALRRGK